MRDESPQYRSVEQTLQSTMNARSIHNKKMSTADHDWIMGLMQNRVRRGTGSRQFVAPVSPSSERASLKNQTSSRARLMSDNRVREIEFSPQQHDKVKLKKPTLSRRFTASACDDKQVPRFDIPLEIRLPNSNDEEHESCDEISEVSLEDDFQSYQGQSYYMDDDPVSCSTASLVGGPSPTARPAHVEWGISTVCIDDYAIWPSDKGSLMKEKESNVVEDAPVHMLAIDDEREDSTTQLLSTKTLFGMEASNEARQGQPFTY